VGTDLEYRGTVARGRPPATTGPADGCRRVLGVLGTAKTRQQVSPPARADALADIILPDHDGSQVRLGDLWKRKPVALVWLRHYG
jgi:hypothetical protein